MRIAGFVTVRLVSGILLLALGGVPLLAAEPESLPEPLTLEYALSLADTAHPSVQSQKAAQARTEAELKSAEANDALSVSIEGRARWVQPPSIAEDDTVTDDHKLSLFVRKPLYDFGYTEAQRRAAMQSEAGSEKRYEAAVLQRRVTIMRAFFDVLLADMTYAKNNEALAVSYIALDRLRNRQEMGQASDIEVFKLESEYQSVRTQLNLSEARQRATRARLANLLNRPGMLPSKLQRPDLGTHRRKVPEYEKLVAVALKQNPEIQALESELAAAQQRVQAARSSGSPRIDGELEASDYSRELGSSDRWRAGVYLEIPLYTGGRVDAAVAAKRADVYEIQASLEQARYTLRQRVLDLWLELQSLKLKREKAYSEQDYRDLYLDRSRANYEMEFKADLGDAMVRLSEAQLELARNNYDYAIAWERLRALTGDQLLEADKADVGEDGTERSG